MTADDVLDAYEPIWMEFALRSKPQFYGIAAGGLPVFDLIAGQTCAFIADYRVDTSRAPSILGDWRCPECQTEWPGLATAMIHMNNAHHMDWLWFARKFRACWHEGIAA